MDISNVRRHLREGFARCSPTAYSPSIIIELAELLYIQPAPADPVDSSRVATNLRQILRYLGPPAASCSACCIMQLHQYHAKGFPILLNRHGLCGCLQDMGGQKDATPLRMETNVVVVLGRDNMVGRRGGGKGACEPSASQHTSCTTQGSGGALHVCNLADSSMHPARWRERE